MTPPSSLTLPAVTVGICTFNRPEQLACLLTALADLAASAYPERRVDVLVVDDGDAGPAEAVVNGLRPRFIGEVRYHHLGSRNVAAARNTVIELASPFTPWVAFIDDDCVPDADWLSSLFEVQHTTGADIVTGHVVYTTTPAAPRWLQAQPFCDFTVYADGEEPQFGTTANALLRSDFLRDTGVRFRSTLGRTGGEDMTFFDDVRKAGGQLRYSAKAVVFEELTPARQQLRYQIYRQLWLGNNMAEINRHTHEWRPSRLVLRGGKWAVYAWVDAFGRLARRQSPQFRWAFALSARGFGLIAGVAGVRLKHRA